MRYFAFFFTVQALLVLALLAPFFVRLYHVAHSIPVQP